MKNQPSLLDVYNQVLTKEKTTPRIVEERVEEVKQDTSFYITKKKPVVQDNQEKPQEIIKESLGTNIYLPKKK
jgi:hypothetical protein